MRKQQWRWVFIGVCVLAAGFLLFAVRPILGPFLVAFALAYLLNPFVVWLEKHGLGRKWAIGVVFIGILAALCTALIVVLPLLYNELTKLAVVLPQTMQSLAGWFEQLRAQWRAGGLPDKVALVLDEHLGQWELLLAQTLQGFLGKLPEILMSLSLFILSPILAIYFLADWKKLQAGFLHLVPQRRRLEWQRFWQDINHVLRRFVRGNLIVAAIVGTLIGIGVKLVGMDYALLVGIICGVTDLIPYFGPLIGAVPAVLLGLIKSPLMAVKIAVVILLAQQLEGNIISPKLMGDSVGLHPLWIVFALLAGGEIGGFWGLLLAVPVAAVVRLIIRHLYLRLVSPDI